MNPEPIEGHAPDRRGRFHHASMISRALLLALPLAAGSSLATAPVPPAVGLRYTPQEIAILAVLDKTSSLPVSTRLSALSQLAISDRAFAEPRHRALLLLEQCISAAMAGQAADRYASRLRELENRGEGQEPVAAIARLQCELTQGWEQRDGRSAFEARHRVYAATATLGFPLLRYRAASDYAREALALGFVDEALAAVQVALRIAEANGDAPYRRDSLMDLALVQADLGQHADAERNSAASLAIAGGAQRTDLLLNRGHVLLRAEKLAEARSVYRQVRQIAARDGNRETDLIAMLNMADANARLALFRDNLVLTREAVALAERLGLDYYKGYAYVSHAFALIDVGRLDQGMAMFTRGVALQERSGELSHVAKSHAALSERLAARNRSQEAYQILKRSVDLDAAARKATRERNAQYLSAVMEAGQKDLAIERLRREKAVAQLQLEKRRMNARAWAVGLASLGVTILALLLAHVRLRRSSRLLAAANARLDYENARDGLTGLYNRAHFIRLFEESRQKPPRRAMLALLDIDHFKRINDQHGHAAGDEVLRQASGRLADALRGSDVVVRWGGEEFLIFADGLDESRQGAQIAQRLLAGLAQTPIHVDGSDLEVTASIGYAEVTVGPQSDLQAELEHIDAALYQAKREGRNRAIRSNASS